VLILVITAGLCTSQASPFSLKTDIQYTKTPEISGFRYWYGDIDVWKKLIFIGTEDIAGFETELHLTFRNRKIVRATLILGPAGLDDENCIKNYKKIVSMLNTKYGHFRYQTIEKDPLIDDLVASSICHPVQAGLYTPTTTWIKDSKRISAVLLGEANEFFIEIEYQFGSQVPESSKLLESL